MLSPIKNTKIYEKVIDQIKEMVKTGEIKSGDKLPPERELAEQLAVSRTSIREALRSLEMLGLVECRQGEGNFIKDNLENSLLEPLSIVFMLQGSKTQEVLELRKIIEPETAALAAKRINKEQLQELREILNILNDTEDKEFSAEMDKKFHYKIAEAAGNLLVSNMMFAVSSLIESSIEDARMNLLLKEENRSILKQQHEYIYKTLEAQDANGASMAMREHLKLINEYILMNSI